jgi:hypothetical protein
MPLPRIADSTHISAGGAPGAGSPREYRVAGSHDFRISKLPEIGPQGKCESKFFNGVRWLRATSIREHVAAGHSERQTRLRFACTAVSSD